MACHPHGPRLKDVARAAPQFQPRLATPRPHQVLGHGGLGVCGYAISCSGGHTELPEESKKYAHKYCQRYFDDQETERKANPPYKGTGQNLGKKTRAIIWRNDFTFELTPSPQQRQDEDRQDHHCY